MTLLQVCILAFIQGLTEFLPISSSAHLALVPQLTDWPDQGLAFDVAVHIGTLIAVVSYFFRDLTKIVHQGLSCPKTGESGHNSNMLFFILLATIPVGLSGLVFNTEIEKYLRSPLVIAWGSILFGILLYLADRYFSKARDEWSINLKDAVIIGLFQSLALIPGVSRSGVTMTAGLMLGLSRAAAARFSFLLAIPVISLAGGHETYKLIQNPAVIAWGQLLTAVILSAIVAFLCIHFFLKIIRKHSLTVFVVYRILLGIALLLVFTGK